MTKRRFLVHGVFTGQVLVLLLPFVDFPGLPIPQRSLPPSCTCAWWRLRFDDLFQAVIFSLTGGVGLRTFWVLSSFFPT